MLDKTKSRSKIFQTPENAILSETDSSDTIFMALWMDHFDKFEAQIFVWKPNAKANDMFGYDFGEGFYHKRR